MSTIKEEKPKFWKHQDNGKVKILNAKLLGFLEREGFATAMISETDHILVRMVNNRMSKVD